MDVYTCLATALKHWLQEPDYVSWFWWIESIATTLGVLSNHYPQSCLAFWWTWCVHGTPKRGRPQFSIKHLFVLFTFYFCLKLWFDGINLGAWLLYVGMCGVGQGMGTICFGDRQLRCTLEHAGQWLYFILQLCLLQTGQLKNPLKFDRRRYLCLLKVFYLVWVKLVLLFFMLKQLRWMRSFAAGPPFTTWSSSSYIWESQQELQAKTRGIMMINLCRWLVMCSYVTVN